MNEEATKAVVSDFKAQAEATEKKVEAAATSFVDTAFDAATRAAIDVLSASRIALGKGAEALALGADKLGALASTLAADAKDKKSGESHGDAHDHQNAEKAA